MRRNNSPVIILVRPQMGENIGAVARAMSNFGLKELRIVAPRDGWPNPKAVEMAAGAEYIIKSAKIFPDLASAMADIKLAYATTARPRDMAKRVVTPEAAMKEIRANKKTSPRTAIVFGPERAGLENEDITWCDTIISIPTGPDNPSLNIAQSAVIIGYEWWQTNLLPLKGGGLRRGSGFSNLTPTQPSPFQGEGISSIAPKSDWQGLFKQLEDYLDSADYFRVAQKKPVMWQNLRTMLMRGQWNAQEVRTFRGMLRSLWERRTK